MDKPTKIQIAIDNVKNRIAKAEHDIILLQKEKDTLWDVLMALENIESHPSFD